MEENEQYEEKMEKLGNILFQADLGLEIWECYGVAKKLIELDLVKELDDV